MEGGEEKGMGDASSARNKVGMMRTDNKEMAKLAGGASDQLPNNDEGQRRLAWPLRIDDTHKSRKNNVKGKVSDPKLMFLLLMIYEVTVLFLTICSFCS